jgi:hypothetical protein
LTSKRYHEFNFTEIILAPSIMRCLSKNKLEADQRRVDSDKNQAAEELRLSIRLLKKTMVREKRSIII